MKQELSNLEIIKKFNRGQSIKEIAEEIGYTESTIRKRINKEYFYSESLKKYVGKDKKKEFEKLEQILLEKNCTEEIAILIMERYKDEEYWEENEYEIWDECFFNEDITINEFLYDELEKDAEKLSVSISDVAVLYILRYLTYLKKQKGSGLKFERNYKKPLNEREKHDTQVRLKDGEYEIRELDREIERLKDEGYDNEEIEFITRYASEEETDILYKSYLTKKGFNNHQIMQIKKNDLCAYYQYVKSGEIEEFEKIKEELKKRELEYKAEVEREEKEYQEKEYAEKKKYIAGLKENGYTDEQIEGLDDYELRKHYKECNQGKTFNEIVQILNREEIERNKMDKYFETDEETRERHIKGLKENRYTDNQILSLNENEISEHYRCIHINEGECFEGECFDFITECLKVEKIKEEDRIKELEVSAEKIVNRQEGDFSWIDALKNDIRLRIQEDIREGKERKIYTGSVAIH